MRTRTASWHPALLLGAAGVVACGGGQSALSDGDGGSSRDSGRDRGTFSQGTGLPGEPCETVADCLWGYCVDSGEGRVCTEPCSGSGECVPGWTCGEAANGEFAAQVCLCTSGPERCDDLDNDCDGTVDESLSGCCAPAEVRPCGVDEGACRPGTETCDDAGRWGECAGGTGPTPEREDAIDNDCDQRIDEGVGNGGPPGTIITHDGGTSDAGGLGTVITNDGGTSDGGADGGDGGASDAGGAATPDECALELMPGSACDGPDEDTCRRGVRLESGLCSGDVTGCGALEGVTQVDGGLHSSHTCALVGGEVYCWGYNPFGEISSTDRRGHLDGPVRMELSEVEEVAVGSTVMCARHATGVIYCWGHPTNRGGTETATFGGRTFTIVEGVDDAVSLDFGPYAGCVAKGDGTVWCWGTSTGIFGDETERGTPEAIAGMSGIVEVGVGAVGVCGRTAAGALWCEGFGDSATREIALPAPAVQVSGSSEQACARLDTGDVYCVSSAGVAQVEGVSNARDVAAANGFGCAALSDGTVRCWGGNNYGQLGVGDFAPHPSPVTVAGIANATGVGAGPTYACAIVGAASRLRCWGANRSGELGIAQKSQVTPTPVPLAVPAGPLGATGSATFIVDQGTLRYFGMPWAYDMRPGLRTLGDPLGVVSVAKSVSGHGGCALLSNTDGACWGNLYPGGTTGLPRTPPTPLGLSGVQAIAAGQHHGCVIVAGEARCWGANWFGQVGDGTTDSRDAIVSTMGTPTDFVDVAASSFTTCAQRANGDVWCWGGRFGATPALYPHVGDVTVLAVGSSTHGAIDGAGQLHVWSGGTGGAPSPPELVPLPRPARNVALASNSICALLDDGEVWCWGDNRVGQLGDGTLVSRDCPFPAQGISDVVDLVAGTGHFCARRATGELLCWGANAWGQTGIAVFVATPTEVVAPGAY